MDKFHPLLWIFLLLLVLTACRPSTSTLPDLPPESMKGYELYSWQDGEQWYFSLLVGTNREKTLDEIQSPGVALKGVEALSLALGKIHSGQSIFWSTRPGLGFPPEAIVSAIQEICKKRGLELSLIR